MLYEFSNLNKHGSIRTRVISWPKVKHLELIQMV